MICDIHAHYIPQKFSDFMGGRFGPRVGVPVNDDGGRHARNVAITPRVAP